MQLTTNQEEFMSMSLLGVKYWNQYLIILLSTICLLGCKEQSSNNSESDISNLASINGSSVNEIILNGNLLTVNGKNLDKITSMKLNSPSGDIQLEIQDSNNKTILARPLSALTLVAGVAYKLIISNAHASQDVPVTISVNLPNLTCTGGSSGPTFMGYTSLTGANLGGLKGGNEICNTSYPGSHWASLDEIMKLGVSYTWAHPVWLRDFSTNETAGSNGDYICRGYNYHGTFLSSNCAENSNALVTYQSGAPTLLPDGTQKYSCCNSQRALACVKN